MSVNKNDKLSKRRGVVLKSLEIPPPSIWGGSEPIVAILLRAECTHQNHSCKVNLHLPDKIPKMFIEQKERQKKRINAIKKYLEWKERKARRDAMKKKQISQSQGTSNRRRRGCEDLPTSNKTP